MRLEAREQIKLLLSLRKMTITELASELTKLTGKQYTTGRLSAKMIRGTLSFNEMLSICDILEYRIDFTSTIEHWKE